MDAEYLKANVGEVLANGLTAVVLNQPEDSVDYLARWLLKYVDNTKAEEALKLQLVKQNEEDKKTEEEESTAKKAAEEAKIATETAASDKKKGLENFLAEASTFEGLYDGFIQHLQDITEVTGVYMGLKETDAIPPEPKSAEEGDEGDEAPSSNLSLQYIAASKDHSFLIGKRLRGSQGLTFDVFKDEVPGGEGGDEGDAGDEGDDEGKDKVAEVVDDGPKTLHIPNVLMGSGAEKMHFWQLPALGSYLSVRMSYDGCLNEQTLDEAIEKEISLLEQKEKEEEEAKTKADSEETAGDEGDEKPPAADEGDEGDAKESTEETKEEEPEEEVKEETEAEKETRERAEAVAKAAAEELYLVSHLPKKALDYAVCLDTVGNSRRFSDEEVTYIKKMVQSLNETVVRIDRQLFKEERIRRTALVTYNESVEAKTEDEIKQEMERLKSNLERAGTAGATDADVSFKYRQNAVMALREKFVEFRQFNVFRGPLEIIQCLMFMLDYDKAGISDLDGKPSWDNMRVLIDDQFFNKLQAYDPREPQIRGRDMQHATVANLRKMVAAYTDEDVKAKNYPLFELLGYISDALAVKKQARTERKEARLAAEAEAAALAAEQAAAAAADGAADGDEGDKAEDAPAEE